VAARYRRRTIVVPLEVDAAAALPYYAGQGGSIARVLWLDAVVVALLAGGGVGAAVGIRIGGERVASAQTRCRDALERRRSTEAQQNKSVLDRALLRPQFDKLTADVKTLCGPGAQ
jgi:hypothetical protein